MNDRGVADAFVRPCTGMALYERLRDRIKTVNYVPGLHP